MKKLFKNYKYDILSLITLTIVFISLVLFLTNGNHIYGSDLDWSAQHAVIPDYFRTLFYNTKDLFPDFALNIGGGQNIYNFSYYGFLSPIILISYLFPKVSMVTYISISSIIIVLISTYLLYIFLRTKNFNSKTSFISCLCFMLSSMSFQSHRHIMFINYMPFLILALFGVDKKLNNNRSWLLCLSTTLMILTSYYYSIGGILCIFIYAFISYLKRMNKVTIKTFFNTFFKILLPVLISICISSILTIPTLATILYNRAESNIFISLKDLLIPNINSKNILYNAYGLGLTSISIIAIVNLFKKNKKEHLALGIILSILVIFNIFNYILNGTMYIDSKSLIPILPMYIISIAILIKDIEDKTINLKVLIPSIIIISILIYINNYKWNIYIIDILITFISILLYYKFNKSSLLVIPLFILIVFISFGYNMSDSLVLKYNYEENEHNISSYIDLITNQDKDFYRISSDVSRTEFPNSIFSNIDYYHNTIYSSISNQVYNKFYYDTLANNMPSRNRALTVSNQNLLSLMLLNNKYMINNNDNLHGYEKIVSNNGLNIYENNDVLPSFFSTREIMSYKDFYNLSDQVKQEALLNVIVADHDSNNSFVSKENQIKLDFNEIFNNENVKKEKDGSYSIYVKNELKITYELPEKYQNKIILLRFKMNKGNSKEDLIITVNGIKNKLTASNWKYYNGNTIFDYVLSYEKQDKLVFNFTKGDYNLSDFEVSILDYTDIENVNKKVDKLIVDKEKTKGDKIVGKINVTNDGYFMASIPYDNGFKIKLDNKVIEYEKVDDAFIGFPINYGQHEIEISYESPLKNIAIKISIVGLIAYIITIVLESKKKI